MATGIIPQTGWSKSTNAFTATSGYAVYNGLQATYKHGSLVWMRLSVNKSDQSVFSQTRHTIGTIASGFRPKENTSRSVPASTAINFYLTRITNVIITTGGEVILDCFQNDDVKQINIDVLYLCDN